MFPSGEPDADAYRLRLVYVDPSGRVWRKARAPRRTKLFRRSVRMPDHGAFDQFSTSPAWVPGAANRSSTLRATRLGPISSGIQIETEDAVRTAAGVSPLQPTILAGQPKISATKFNPFTIGSRPGGHGRRRHSIFSTHNEDPSQTVEGAMPTTSHCRPWRTVPIGCHRNHWLRYAMERRLKGRFAGEDDR